MYVSVFGEGTYKIQKKRVWLGATLVDCMQSGEGEIGVICSDAKAGRRLKNNMYVVQSNNKKLSGFFYSKYSCSVHLISL